MAFLKRVPRETKEWFEKQFSKRPAFILFPTAFFVSFLSIHRFPPLLIDESLMFLASRQIVEGFFSHLVIFPVGLPSFYLPFLHIFGFADIAYRLTQSVLLAAAVVFTYRFAISFYDKKTALVTALVLITTPGFILLSYSRYPAEVFFASAFLFFLQKFLESKRTLYLALSALVIGFAITFELSFIYFLIAAAPAFLVFEKKLLKIFDWKKLFAASISLIIGLSPLVLMNVYQDMYTVDLIQENLLETGRGHRNIDFIQNLETRTGEFYDFWFLLPEGFERFQLHQGKELKTFTLQSTALFLLFVVSIIYAFITKNRKTAILLTISFVVFVLLSFVPRETSPHHFIIITVPLLIPIARFLRERSKIILVVLIILNLVTLFHVNYLVLEEENRRELWPGWNSVHKDVEEHLGHHTVFTFSWLEHYMYSRNPGKDTYFVPTRTILIDGRPHEGVAVNETRELFKETIEAGRRENQRVSFVFPNPRRMRFNEVEVYQHSCTGTPREVNPCTRPIKIFHDLIRKEEIDIDENITISGNFENPVYYIYKL